MTASLHTIEEVHAVLLGEVSLGSRFTLWEPGFRAPSANSNRIALQLLNYFASKNFELSYGSRGRDVLFVSSCESDPVKS